VKDDGAGLPDALPKNAGMGLRIMAHRASMVGGTFEARREESGGTIVCCVVRHQNNSGKT
jgi:nitrate/nitrite-specific signal transduction histidine kinase